LFFPKLIYVTFRDPAGRGQQRRNAVKIQPPSLVVYRHAR
jgi:hypothetical protein